MISGGSERPSRPSTAATAETKRSCDATPQGQKSAALDAETAFSSESESVSGGDSSDEQDAEEDGGVVILKQKEEEPAAWTEEVVEDHCNHDIGSVAAKEKKVPPSNLDKQVKLQERDDKESNDCAVEKGPGGESSPSDRGTSLSLDDVSFLREECLVFPAHSPSQVTEGAGSGVESNSSSSDNEVEMIMQGGSSEPPTEDALRACQPETQCEEMPIVISDVAAASAVHEPSKPLTTKGEAYDYSRMFPYFFSIVSRFHKRCYETMGKNRKKRKEIAWHSQVDVSKALKHFGDCLLVPTLIDEGVSILCSSEQVDKSLWYQWKLYSLWQQVMHDYATVFSRDHVDMGSSNGLVYAGTPKTLHYRVASSSRPEVSLISPSLIFVSASFYPN